MDLERQIKELRTDIERRDDEIHRLQESHQRLEEDRSDFGGY